MKIYNKKEYYLYFLFLKFDIYFEILQKDENKFFFVIIHTLEYKFDYLKEKNDQINLYLKKMKDQNMNFLFFSFYESLHYM